MKRQTRTFDIENGFLFDIVRKAIKDAFPRRPFTAYSRKDKSYVMTINLDCDELKAILTFLDGENINAKMDSENLLCKVSAVHADLDFTVTLTDIDDATGLLIDIRILDYHARFKYSMLSITGKSTDFELSTDAHGIKHDETTLKEFIKAWAQSYWTGKHGAYKLTNISFK